MRKRISWFLVFTLLCLFQMHARPAKGEQPRLELVASLNLPGSFSNPQSLYADNKRVYLASKQGEIFVLSRQEKDWTGSHKETVTIGSELNAIRGDVKKIYVTSSNGNLYVFKNGRLELDDVIPLSTYGLRSLAVIGRNVYIATGQTEMVADKERVYVSQAIPGDFAFELRDGVPTGLTYATTFFNPEVIQIFETSTGNPAGGLLNPVFPPRQVALALSRDYIFIATPGCCGGGFYVIDKAITAARGISRPLANAVAVAGEKEEFVVVGTETGLIDLFDLSQNSIPLISSVDLGSITGFTGPGEIQIRSLWVAGDLIFAGSSWATQNPAIPSFFVLEIK